MALSEEYLQKFKELYREQFGKELSDQETYDKAFKLLRLIQLVYTPSSKGFLPAAEDVV